VDLELADKVVCVTGSTRGIGRAIAEVFLREGAKVAISGRTRQDLDRTFSDLTQRWNADRILAVQADLISEQEIQRCIATIEQQWNALDILVANVGSGSGKTGWDVGAQEWDRLLNLNLVGGAQVARFAMPLMRASRSGCVVFLSSLAGAEILPAPVPYTCAKAGVIALTKALSRLLASDGIRVNAVAPGNILFKNGVWQRKLDADPDQVHAYINSEVPLKRMGKPEEVANAVAFLASPRASFITGVTLFIDGGQARAW
jgi:3-oxoacyl-[acyl-carrier protein] reductase